MEVLTRNGTQFRSTTRRHDRQSEGRISSRRLSECAVEHLSWGMKPTGTCDAPISTVMAGASPGRWPPARQNICCVKGGWAPVFELIRKHEVTHYCGAPRVPVCSSTLGRMEHGIGHSVVPRRGGSTLCDHRRLRRWVDITQGGSYRDYGRRVCANRGLESSAARTARRGRAQGGWYHAKNA